jgi:hypothetical protein
VRARKNIPKKINETIEKKNHFRGRTPRSTRSYSITLKALSTIKIRLPRKPAVPSWFSFLG